MRKCPGFNWGWLSVSPLDFFFLFGVAQGVFLAVALLVVRHGRRQANGYMAALLLLFSLSLLNAFQMGHGFATIYPFLFGVEYASLFLYGPLLYFYIRALTVPGFVSFRWRVAVHFVPFMLVFFSLIKFYMMAEGSEHKLWLQVLNASNIENGTTLSKKTEYDWMPLMHLFVYLLLGLRKIRDYRTQICNANPNIERNSFLCFYNLLVLMLARNAGNHIKRFRSESSELEHSSCAWLQNLMAVFLIVSMMFAVIEILPQAWINYQALDNGVHILTVVMCYLLGFFAIRQPEVFARKVHESVDEAAPVCGEKYKKTGLDQTMSLALYKELVNSIQRDKLHQYNDLSLNKLAGHCGLSSHSISQAINEHAGCNFYEFINRYRVQEARRLLQDPDMAGMSVLEIALRAGFNSKSVFYAVFKKRAGNDAFAIA